MEVGGRKCGGIHRDMPPSPGMVTMRMLVLIKKRKHRYKGRSLSYIQQTFKNPDWIRRLVTRLESSGSFLYRHPPGRSNYGASLNVNV